MRVLIWFIGVVCLLFAFCVTGAFWLKGREFTAPLWLRDQITTRIELAVPDLDIGFGSVAFHITDDWRPQFAVSHLRLSTPQGMEIISVSSVEGALDNAGLLLGRLGLTTLQASGVFVTLRRNAEGALAVSAGAQPVSASREALDLAGLVSDIDDFLLRPAVSGLSSVTVDAVTLRYEDARAGRVWTVDGGRLWVNREDRSLQVAADLAILDGDGDVATLSANYAGVIGQRKAGFGVSLTNLDARDIASQGPALSWLQALEAPISGALRGGINEDGNYEPLSATLQIGAGVIQPTPQASPIPIDGARSYFSYFPQEQRLRFDEFVVNTQWGNGQLDGQALLGAVKDGRITDLVAQFRLFDLSVNPDSLYPDPVSIEAAEVDFRLSLAPFTLEVGRLQVTDQGQTLSAHGTVSVGDAGWKIAMNGELDGLAAPRLIELWPERVNVKTRNWLVKNIRQGNVRHATGAARIEQAGERRLSLGFDFENAHFTFADKLPPVREGKGHASFNNNRFVVVMDEGGLIAPQGGYVNGAGSSFIVPDTEAKPDPLGIVRLRAKGAITAALSLLDRPPLEVMKKANLPVELADGHLEVAGTVFLPLKKKPDIEEVSFDVLGSLFEVRSTALVKGRVVDAQRLELAATDKEVRIAGKGGLDSVPLDVVWRQKLGRPEDSLPGQITGTVEITQDTLSAFNIDLPSGAVRGAGNAKITLDMLKGTAPSLKLSSDLLGLALTLAPIGWSKPAQQAGVLEVDVTLGEQAQVDRLVLNAPGLEASGSVKLTADAKLERVRLDRVRLGSWLDAPVDIVGRGEGAPVGIELRGGTVDLRRADLPPPAKSTEPSGPLTVALDRLQISDSIALTNLKGTFSTTNGLEGNFAGSVNAAAPVTGLITPQNGRSAVRLKAKNAGRVIAAAGLVQKLRDGQMDLVLVPVGTGGAFDGKLLIQKAKVSDAPAIAALLNSVSVVGLVNELTGDGIYFSEITADFRLAPSRITLRHASAVGASMGLSMDGIFEQDTGKIQMQGVISPIYILNSIGSVLTRKGEGLFGFNYSITGSAREPEVFVNPLTALAPGMLRNLFRGAAPEVLLEEGEPVPVPEPRRTPVVTSGQDR